MLSIIKITLIFKSKAWICIWLLPKRCFLADKPKIKNANFKLMCNEHGCKIKDLNNRQI